MKHWHFGLTGVALAMASGAALLVYPLASPFLGIIAGAFACYAGVYDALKDKP